MISNTQTLKVLFNSLEQIKIGSLEIDLPNQMGKKIFRGSETGPNAHIAFKTINAIKNVIQYGDIGFGKDYINGNWETDCLKTLLLFSCRNDQYLKNNLYSGQIILTFFYRCLQYLRRNSIRGSLKNIQYHYDNFSNDFYSLWLDHGMNYSSGMSTLTSSAQSLESLQANKNSAILKYLNDPKNILEIGCGWGAFMELAATQEINVRGISLSRQQLLYANNRLNQAKLSRYAQGFFCDYREEKGIYDNVVSIEMMEHVGIENWDVYLKKIRDSLSMGGRAVVQTSIIHDEIYDSYIKSSDFIRTFIFPGGLLPADKKIKEIVNNIGFNIDQSLLLGNDAALTMTLWLEKFKNSKSQVKLLGYNDQFIRMWEFYLSYCLSAYMTGRINVGQYILTKVA